MCDACKNAAKQAIAALPDTTQSAVDRLIQSRTRAAELYAREMERDATDAECRLEDARYAFTELREKFAKGSLTNDDFRELRRILAA